MHTNAESHAEAALRSILERLQVTRDTLIFFKRHPGVRLIEIAYEQGYNDEDYYHQSRVRRVEFDGPDERDALLPRWRARMQTGDSEEEYLLYEADAKLSKFFACEEGNIPVGRSYGTGFVYRRPDDLDAFERSFAELLARIEALFANLSVPGVVTPGAPDEDGIL